MTTEPETTRLPSKKDGEGSMAILMCAACQKLNEYYDAHKTGSYNPNAYLDPRIVISCYRGPDNDQDDHQVRLEGVLTCIRDGNKWPFTMERNIVLSTSQTLLVAESEHLTARVPEGLRQDVEEAELAHLGRTYKGCVVLCRRALQLALEALNVEPINGGRTLGPYLAGLKAKGIPDAKAPKGARFLTDGVYALAEGIKDIGDQGAHRKVNVSANDAAMVVYVTVRVLKRGTLERCVNNGEGGVSSC